MKDLGRDIVDSLLGNKIALIPGGYKPPTAGHFYLVEQAAKQPGVAKAIVLIGHKERDGLTKEQSYSIWEIYKKYLPKNVEIQISKEKAPILDMFHLLRENDSQNYLALIGIRDDKDRKDLKRFKTLKENFGERVEVVAVDGVVGISGTNAREVVLNKDVTSFNKFLPMELTTKDKVIIWEILQESYKGKRTDNGAPGTFKAKITKAYGGPVTVAKAKKFKNRKNATAHDKSQANWFINFHSAKNENQIIEDDDPCWDDYKVGNPKTKISSATGKRVNNCVPKENIEPAHTSGKSGKYGSAYVKVKENVNFKTLEATLDEMFDDLDIDVAFTKHFKERVIERGLTEEDIVDLMEKIHDRHGDEVADLPKGENRVFTHIKRLVDIASAVGGYNEEGLKDLYLTTAYKRKSQNEPEFRTSSTSPKIKVAEATIVAPAKPEPAPAPVKAAPPKPKKASAQVYEYTVSELMEKFPAVKTACEGAFEKATHPTPEGEDESGSPQKYATFLSNQDNARKELKKLPNIKIVDGTVVSGLSRVQAIYILQNLAGVSRDGNPTADQEAWLKFKLKCEVEGENPEAQPELDEAGTDASAGTTSKNQNEIVEDLKPLIEEFTNYAAECGKSVMPPPKVLFVDNIENAKNTLGKTAYYDPENKAVTLYITNRHPKDILRSYAHELIHHQQNLEDRLGNITTTNVNEDDNLKKLEEEAYLESQIMLRSWENGRGNKSSLNEVIVHDKSKGTWTVKSEKEDRSFGTYKTEKEAKKRLRQIEFFKHKAKNEHQELLQEGTYDLITRQVTKDILQDWKTEYTGQTELLTFEEFYEEIDSKGRTLDFEVLAQLKVEPGLEYTKDGGANAERDPAYLEVFFGIDPKDLPGHWSKIYMDLIDVVRHEIEHLTQSGPNARTTKQDEFDADQDQVWRMMIDAEMLPPVTYFRLPMELDAMLQGMYLKAKKEKVAFQDVVSSYLDKHVRKGLISADEKQQILNLWRTRLPKLNLPSI